MQHEWIDPVLRVTVSRVPEEEEVDDLVATALAARHPFVVLARETTTIRPTYQIINHVLTHLTAHTSFIDNSLLATVIQPKTMGRLTRTVVKLVLRLYRPRKPLCISTDTIEIAAFLKSMNVPRGTIATVLV